MQTIGIYSTFVKQVSKHKSKQQSKQDSERGIMENYSTRLSRKGDSNEMLKVDLRKQSADARFRVVTFKDGDYVVAFLPSLNLTGYGATDEEAIEMLMGIVLKDFLENIFTLPADKFFAELRQYGWERNPYLRKQMRSTLFVDREGVLRNFNLPEETIINEQYITA